LTAVSTRDLCKRYRPPAPLRALLRGRLRGDPVTALEHVTFDLESSEVLGLVGENGAGKTTLLRILAGLLLPTSGEAHVLGQDVRHVGAAFRARVGLLGAEDRGFSFRLTGRQNLAFFAALHGWSAGAARDRVASLIDRVGLAGAADRRAGTYSSGMRARLSLARGLLGDPEILLCDEPTRGLDPRAAAEFRALLAGLAAGGRAIVVATHDLGEVHRLCGRVAVMEGGRLRALVPAAEAAATLGLDA
jgi:ABC-2 type transport system ATP-binding protein